MTKSKLTTLMTFVLSFTFFAYCGGGGSQPQSGFKTTGETWVQVFGGTFIKTGTTSIAGQWLFDIGNATGTVRSFNRFCVGLCPIEGGRVTARWNIVAGTPQAECIGYLEPTQRDVTANSTQVSRCVRPGLVFLFAAAPNLVDLTAPPATVEMMGENLTTEYGMPYIEYRDPYTGDLIGATSAISVSAKGTVLQAAVPDLSSVYDGVYNVLISNIRADGSLEPVGMSTIECTGRPYTYEPPPDPGPCGCPPNQPCMPCVEL